MNAYTRDQIVAMWTRSGDLSLFDFSDSVRSHLLSSTREGWDRALTIRDSRWRYADLCPEAQARVDRALALPAYETTGV